MWRDELDLKRIQSWIERLPRHLQKVKELRGGNEYREWKSENNEWSDIRPYNSEERQQRYESWKKGLRLGSSNSSGVVASIEAAGRAGVVGRGEVCKASEAVKESSKPGQYTSASRVLGLGLDGSMRQADQRIIRSDASDSSNSSDGEDGSDSDGWNRMRKRIDMRWITW